MEDIDSNTHISLPQPQSMEAPNNLNELSDIDAEGEDDGAPFEHGGTPLAKLLKG